MVTRIRSIMKSLIILAIVLVSMPAYAGGPATRIFERIFVRAINVVIDRGRTVPLGTWQAEMPSAIRIAMQIDTRAMSKAVAEGVDKEVINLLVRHSRSPSDALACVKGRKLSGLLHREWESLLSRRFNWVSQRVFVSRSPGAVERAVVETSVGFSTAHVDQYYVTLIRELIEFSFSRSGGSPGPGLPGLGIQEIIDPLIFQIREQLERLQEYFFGGAKARVGTSSAAEIRQLRGQFLVRMGDQIDTAMPGAGVPGGNHPTAAVLGGASGRRAWLTRLIEADAAKIKRLARLLKKYGQYLISHEHVVFDADYFMAQIRFGDFEAQKMAFDLLLQHLETQGVSLSVRQLQFILMHSGKDLRSYVVTVLKGRHYISVQAMEAADSVVQLAREFCMGEAAFEEAMTTLTYLLNVVPNGEAMIGRVLGRLESTVVQKIAALRALGKLETLGAYEVMVEHFEHVMQLGEDRLLRVYAEEVALGHLLNANHFENAVELLQRMADHMSRNVQREGIRALGIAFEGKDSVVVLKLLGRYLEPTLRGEVFYALSRARSAYSLAVDEAVAAIAETSDVVSKDLRAGAALYLIAHGNVGQEARAFFVLFEVLEESSVISEYVLLHAGATAAESPLSRDFTLRIFRLFQDVLADVTQVAPVIREFVNHVHPDAVTVEALAVLAKTQSPETATLLLEVFDGVVGSQKRRVLEILFLNYDDIPTLRKILGKIIDLYRIPAMKFDIFDGMMQNLAPVERLRLLFNDAPTITRLEEIVSHPRQESPSLVHFAQAMLAALR